MSVSNPPASINLTWTPPNMTAAEASLTGYRIIIDLEDSPEQFVANVGLETSHLQTGLRPRTTYIVVIAAVNLIGTGNFSSPVRVTSGEGSRQMFTTQYQHAN